MSSDNSYIMISCNPTLLSDGENLLSVIPCKRTPAVELTRDNLYTSIACNRNPEAADWGPNNYIIFAACNAIALVHPTFNNGSPKIIKLFLKHTAKVNTVKWISKTEFLSSSYDKLCYLWHINHCLEPITWALVGHTDGVTVVDAIQTQNKWLIATTSLDSTIRLWSLSEEKNNYETISTISLGTGFCFALKLAALPNGDDKILLAYSTDQNTVHLACDQIVNGKREFIKVDTLIGHENWVRGLDIISLNDNELLIASSSQDTFIRLWRISSRPTIKPAQIDKANIFMANDDIQIEERIFTVENATGKEFSYAVSLESVLLGHDGWVYGVHWSRNDKNQLQLLSSSIDKTLIIWAQQDDTGVWTEKIRVGEVGGNLLGFYGGKFSPDSTSIMGHGYQGSFHIWRDSQNKNNWIPDVVVGGHFGEVRDLCWNPRGEYLLTVSADQTTRCHAPWLQCLEYGTWHEIARPQVHGYDMQTICILSRYSFASGAEEKIVRTFQAPANFIENFKNLAAIRTDKEDEKLINEAPKGASVPSLGLSNKAVYDESIPVSADERHIKDQYPDNYFVPIRMMEPPTEETLMQNTLWPEIQKLYGHGYEIFSLTATTDGKVLASSCRATNEEHAQVILWNTSTWKQFQKLPSHQLTVTQMRFSPNNKWLLVVSRDRRWSLFENKKTESNADDEFPYDFNLIATTGKKNGIHSRIIWTCDWTHDSKVFATGSRDGKIVAWHRTDTETETSLGPYKDLATFKSVDNESVTAVAFAPYFMKNGTDYLAAIGLENGRIQICSLSGTNWNVVFNMDQATAHHLTVKKLQFRPLQKEPFHLASCGIDNLTRIYKINV